MEFITTTLSIFFWFLVILLPLVIFHEFGHLLAARLTGTKVPEFGIGIPPRVTGKRWKGILWSLNYIPLGGFVRIYGDGDAADAAVDNLEIAKQEIASSAENLTPKEKKESLASKEDSIKKEYTTQRYEELIQNRELDYFVEQNGMELTSEWKNQIKSKTLDENKKEQVETLIKWEFDGLVKNKEAFYNKPFWAKILIMLGGITANFILAFVILVTLLTFFSIPSSLLPQSFANSDSLVKISEGDELVIAYVVKDSLADKQGLKDSDSIVSLNGQNFNDTDKFTSRLVELGGSTINLTVRQGDTGVIQEKSFELPKKEGDKPQLGIVNRYTYKAKNFWSAIPAAFFMILNFSLLIFILLGQIFMALISLLGLVKADQSALEAVGGPIAIGDQGGMIFENFGVEGIFTALAIVSVNLGVFNLLPIPALDGGRVVILTLQKIFGRRNRRLEYSVITFTFIFMLLLGVGIAVRDVLNLGK
jgi:regulator of sigma E protease